jgi:hypothetical protein
LASLGLGVSAAFGADFPIGLRRADLAAIAQSRPRGQVDLVAMTVAAPPPIKSITLGLAYEDDQDGSHALTTPFLLDYLSDAWEFAVSGDGYTHATSSDKTLSDFGDVDLAAQYAFALADGWSVTPGLGFTLPAGGRVGTRHLAETGQMLAAFSPNAQWTILVGGFVRHSGDAPSGISAYSDAVLAKALYAWDNSHAAFVAFKRDHTRGDGGSSAVIAEVDFPSASTTGAAISVSHGLSRGKRYTTIEFDLSF